MSINCLLTNDVVLEKLVALVDAKSGNVSSVAGVLPIVVAPTAGDVVVSLPIAGAWTATNNVVKSTASNALEWGVDAGLPVPTISLPPNLIDATPWFNAGSDIEYNIVEYAGLYTIYTQVIGATTQLTATASIIPSQKPTFAFLIPSFQLIVTYAYPANVLVVGGVVCVCQMTITPFSATQSACTVNIQGLTCALGDTLVTYLPSFTLTVGM